MKIEKQITSTTNYEYTVKDGIPAHLNRHVWPKILHTLINIRDCNLMPNLQDLRLVLKEAIQKKESVLKETITQFNSVIG